MIAVGIGAVGVIALVTSTSAILQSGDADMAIPGALALFAGVFNVFVATLNILHAVVSVGTGAGSDLRRKVM